MYPGAQTAWHEIIHATLFVEGGDPAPSALRAPALGELVRCLSRG